MHAPKYDLLRRRIVELVHAHGDVLTSESSHMGPEIALALNADPKQVTDSLYKLRRRGILHDDGPNTLSLDPDWQELLRPEELAAMGNGLTASYGPDDEQAAQEDDTFLDAMKVEEHSRNDDEVHEHGEDDEEITMGRAVIRAAAQAIAKVEQAEEILGRYVKLNEENVALREAVERLRAEVGNGMEMEKKVERLEQDNRRLSTELKKRSGNTVASRLSGEERQAMTRLMKDLKRRA